MKEGGGAYLFVACLSDLTIDHASLSRQNTAPTFNRGTSNVWAHVFSAYYILVDCFWLILSPSCSTVCAHHLSPTIAIVFSLFSSVPKLVHATLIYFPHLSTHPVPPCTFHILPLCVFCLRFPCNKGPSVHLLPHPPNYWYTFCRSRPLTRNRSFSVV